MRNFDFIFTDDNSVGLYDKNVKDIYHSKTGAYREAIEKFIEPTNLNLRNGNIKILDICYGIGYNTKAAIANINNNSSLQIDCLEYNKQLTILSPFIIDAVEDVNIKIFILASLLQNGISLNEIIYLISDIQDDDTKQFFDKTIINLIEYIQENGYINNPQGDYFSFLHNIYYNYISDSMKKRIMLNKFNGSTINYYFGDARKTIKLLDKVYDIVFLDAFSSQKDPTLWTINFLSEIKNKMNYNSVLVTYSKSTPFRSALLELGFSIGKTFINGIDMGTIASQNSNNINNPLTDYDIELLSTRSGITYKDSQLNLLGKEILLNRENEQKTSSRISHTAFLKKYSK